MEIPIYNLYVGKKRPPAAFCLQKIGPFEVELIREYEEVAERISAERLSARESIFGGEWVQTAVARIDDSSTECSILSREKIEDKGAWDLCEILTFVTGRRVCDLESRTRYLIGSCGPHACVDTETLLAGALAWNNRQKLLDCNMVYALLLCNIGFQNPNLHIMAPLYSTAFNIVYESWKKNSRRSAAKIDKPTKKNLKEKVKGAIESCEELSKEQKQAYAALIGSKIDQGTESPVAVMEELLKDLGVIKSDTGEEVMKRIKHINRVRNLFIHSGNPPEYEDAPHLSIDVCVSIVGGLLPELVQMMIGKTFGFTAAGAGSLSQNTRDLERYFNAGLWRGHPVEKMTYEEWQADVTDKNKQDDSI